MSISYKTNATQKSCSSQQQITMPSPWGKGLITVGHVKKGIFYKNVRDKNILKKPLALCFDEGILFKLQRLNVHTLAVKHKENQTIWAVPFKQFLQDAIAINRGGAGAQKCLLLEKWNVVSPGKNAKEQQLQLFGGM